MSHQESNNYDPYKAAPFTQAEKIQFNVSIVFITLVSSFVFALLMATAPSFYSATVGLIWAIPGLLVLAGFHAGRSSRKIRTLHTCVFIAEIIFLVYMVAFCAAALSPTMASLGGNPKIALTIDISILLIYIYCLEFGFLRLLKRHETAYYDEILKK